MLTEFIDLYILYFDMRIIGANPLEASMVIDNACGWAYMEA